MKQLARVVLVLTLLWNLLCYIFIPHLTWLPGYTNTWFIDNGLIYFKDFIQAHFFLPHLFLYPFLKLTNWHIETDPFIALVVASLGSIMIFHFGRKILSPVYLIISLVFYSLFIWYASTWLQFSGEMLAGLFLLVSTFQAINLIKSKKGSLFVFGILLTLTLLTGQILGPAVLFLTAVVFYKLGLKRKNIIPFMTAVIILVLPICIYFILKNAFTDFFYWNITYYLNYAKFTGSTKSSLPWFEIIAFYSPLILLPLTKSLKRFTTEEFIISSVVFISLPLTILSIFHPHHYLISLPLMALILGLSLQNMKDKVKIVPLLPIILLSIFMLNNTFNFYKSKINFAKPFTNLNELSRDKDQEIMVNWISANTDTNERIMVTGDPMFYVRARRLPANNRYSALPWHYLPLPETKKIILNKLPLYWIVDSNYLKRFETGWKTPEISDFIKDTLNSCYKIDVESGPWSIWKKTC